MKFCNLCMLIQIVDQFSYVRQSQTEFIACILYIALMKQFFFNNFYYDQCGETKKEHSIDDEMKKHHMNSSRTS